ncbi:MAG: shikimate kinase [Candidatus Cryptobacteroides sp.]
MIIGLTGFMGSGKSSVGARLAARLNFEFIDLDRYIEEKIGLSIPEIFALEGENSFRAIEAEALRDVVVMHQLTHKDLVLSLGGGTITIAGVRQLILEDMLCIYLKAEISTLKKRLETEMECRPLLKEEVAMERLLQERSKLYESVPYSLCTDGKSLEEVEEELYKLIKKEVSR